ncbi:MAG: FG-GAP repeat domain-containing protein, partial [Thermodesulfobacteriota bacterium]
MKPQTALIGILLLAAGCTQSAATPSPRFVEETTAAGIDHVYDGDWEFFVGGGVAAFDCNGDGRPDLFFAGGSNPASLYRNESATGGALRFVLQEGALAVEAVSGAYPLDIDGDGILDLAVLRVGENLLFRGRGDCRFERANDAWGFQGGKEWTTAFSARWEAGSQWPTLAVGNYVDRDRPGAPFGTCHDNHLFRPAAGGRGFAPPKPLRPGHCPLSMLFSDWNRSGHADLLVTNDRQYYRGGEDQLWRIRPSQAPVLYGRGDGWQKLEIWGMGIASHDLTGDGYPEYFFTSMGDNKLRGLAGGPERPDYADMARDRGVTAHQPFTGGDVRPSTAWHAEFRDVNSDGLMDLFVAKGNVEAMEEAARRDPSNLLLGQPDGRFVERAADAGLLNFARARGAAVADFNLDGLLDLAVLHRRENVKVWRNVGRGTAGRPRAMGHWLALRLRQRGGNRDAVGAWIEVRAGERMLRRELTVGGGHAGGQLGWL